MSELHRDEATVELLGVLAYAQLSGFTRLMGDVDLIPRLGTKLALARLAVAQFGRFERLTLAMEAHGIDPEQAMSGFVAIIDEYHARTQPADWVEGLVKAYIGDGVSGDVYDVVDPLIDDGVRDIVEPALTRARLHTDLLVAAIREELERDPARVGRLSLYARRIAGEALAQAQRIAVSHDALAHLVVGQAASGRGQVAGLAELLSRFTQSHSERMTRLGLTA